MKRFFISDSIKKIANKYLNLLDHDNRGFQHPKKKLKKLIETIPDNTITNPYVQYVQKIIEEWDKLIVLLPSKFEVSYNEFNKILDSSKLSNRLWGENMSVFMKR